MKIKKIIFGILMMWGLLGFSQQDPMYTQYMFNTLSVNPAYAGSRDALSVLALYRTQWLGMNGAPVTQTLTVHSPFYKKNMGLGLSLLNDRIGSTNQTQVFVDYSYLVKLGDRSKLRFGLKGGFSIFQSDVASLNSKESADQTVFNYKGKILPNIGIGVFYYGNKGYLGLSVPKILTNYVTGTNDVEIGVVRRHFFLVGGYVMDLNKNIKFKPSFMLRMVSGAPLSLDLSGIFYFYDKLGVGLAMRREDSFSGLIHYYFSPSFYLGYAYDFTRTELRQYSNGTHEFMLGYDFRLLNGREKIYSPRFF
jgi:type IX secretion system PorP/SprF family membrane protein